MVLYNHAEILCSEMPIFRDKENYYFFEELDNRKPFVKVGYYLVDLEHKLYKPIYEYN